MSENNTEDATLTETEEIETETSTETTDTTSGEDVLGDAGTKALRAMKERVKVAEKAARDTAALLAKREAADALRDKPAEEQAIEAARAEARSEATQKANERILKADLRAAATGKLADPTDAALYIDLTQFTVSDDGDTSSDALTEAITELLERKPHLAAGKPARFDGGADQGAKGKDSKLSQLTEADLISLTPEQINAARKEGRLAKVLSGSKN